MISIYFQDIWVSILGTDDLEDDSDFFKMGAGSMDVVRYVKQIFFILIILTIHNLNFMIFFKLPDYLTCVILL